MCVDIPLWVEGFETQLMVKIAVYCFQNIAADDLASCENVFILTLRQKFHCLPWMCIYNPHSQWKLKTSFSTRAYCFRPCFPETGLDRNPMCVVLAFPVLRVPSLLPNANSFFARRGERLLTGIICRDTGSNSQKGR